MSVLDTVKILGLWAAGLVLVVSLAAVAYARSVKARIARSLRLSEALWDAQARTDLLPHDHPGEDDTAIQAVPVATGYVDADGNPRYRLRHDPPPSRSFWPMLEHPLRAPWENDNPLDPLAREGDGWWYGD